MNKFWEFSKKNNLVDFGFIFILISVLFFFFYAGQCLPFVDYGREAYVPWQMLNGEVLYKDIFNVYGPLGYQINALAYKLFGVHLRTLYGLGFLNSFIISSFVYLISKLFLNRKISLCITGVVVTYCIFSYGIHNLVMPYSFNAVYSLSGVMASVYAMMLYLKEKSIHNLVLSFLFAGFSFANKVEYLPYFCFLFLLLPFVLENKKDWKSYIFPIAAFFVFPLVSFAVLLGQGVEVSDCFNAFVLMKKLLATPAVKFFYTSYGLYFEQNHFLLSCQTFGKMMFKCVILGAVFYGLNYINFRFVKNKMIRTLANLFVLVVIGYCIKINMINAQRCLSVFSWIGMFVLLTIAGFFLREIKYYFKDKKFEISETEKMFLFLCVSSILLSFKGFFHVSQQCYGTLLIPILIIPVYVFFTNYVPLFVKQINSEIWNKVVVNLSLIGIIIFLFVSIDEKINNNLSYMKTSRGVITSWKCPGLQGLVNYIEKNTSKESTLVVVPEGAMINFLADRKSHNKYYYLIPVNVQVFGEKNILKDFEQNPPDYFVVHNLPYEPYNVGTFGQYAPEIYDFILENYTPEIGLNGKLNFVLFKKDK